LAFILLESNQLTSVDMDGLVLWSSYASSVADNLLDSPALDAFYTSLGVDVGETGVINVTGNPGTATDDPTIATAKGYTVVGT
jgi:hypothetical protein